MNAKKLVVFSFNVGQDRREPGVFLSCFVQQWKHWDCRSGPCMGLCLSVLPMRPVNVKHTHTHTFVYNLSTVCPVEVHTLVLQPTIIISVCWSHSFQKIVKIRPLHVPGAPKVILQIACYVQSSLWLENIYTVRYRLVRLPARLTTQSPPDFI